MKLSARQLTWATLDRQLLLERSDLDVVAAVKHLGALQAQEPASPYLAVWNRLADFDFSDLDRAFADRAIVKCPLMRITLHAVAVSDRAMFHEAVFPILRASRLNDRRFSEANVSSADADALIPDLVDFASEPRTTSDIARHLERQLGDEPSTRLWWALRTYAPLIHTPDDQLWTFGRHPRYEAPPTISEGSSLEAVPALIHRYLAAFGPATPQDISQYTMLPMRILKPALAAMAPELVEYDHPDGGTALDSADARALPDPDRQAPPRLLGMWDSALLAYRNRNRIIPDAHRSHVIRRNGDVLPSVLINGRIVGVWRLINHQVEVTPLEKITDDHLGALDTEARTLVAATTPRDPDLYRRYSHWWTKLPSDRRVTIGPQ
jgi:hypothetical protein